MSKQFVKSLTMLTLVVGLALAATVVSANGQMTSQLAIADIPFDFIVADKTLPSGKYAVSKATDNGQVLRISSHDGKSSVIRLSIPAIDTSKKQNARMVFHRYGQQYFLAQVWTGDSYGRELRQCQKERRLRKEMASIASNSDSGKASYETVEVVAMVR